MGKLIEYRTLEELPPLHSALLLRHVPVESVLQRAHVLLVLVREELRNDTKQLRLARLALQSHATCQISSAGMYYNTL